MKAFEDWVQSFPEERVYLGLISIAAGGYAIYLSTQIMIGVPLAFGVAVLALGLIMFTDHPDIVDSLVEPMMGAAGVSLLFPYAKGLADIGTQLPEPATGSLLAFGVLLLVASTLSLIYQQE